MQQNQLEGHSLQHEIEKPELWLQFTGNFPLYIYEDGSKADYHNEHASAHHARGHRPCLYLSLNRPILEQTDSCECSKEGLAHNSSKSQRQLENTQRTPSPALLLHSMPCPRSKTLLVQHRILHALKSKKHGCLTKRKAKTDRVTDTIVQNCHIPGCHSCLGCHVSVCATDVTYQMLSCHTDAICRRCHWQAHLFLAVGVELDRQRCPPGHTFRMHIKPGGGPGHFHLAPPDLLLEVTVAAECSSSHLLKSQRALPVKEKKTTSAVCQLRLGAG
eukprot:scaffold247526_cov16-Tisochrysis_lutea.AAC.2